VQTFALKLGHAIRVLGQDDSGETCGGWQCDGVNGKQYIYVCINTNQTLNPILTATANPTTKQHAIMGIQLNIVRPTCPTCPEKFIGDMLLHRFFYNFPLSVSHYHGG